MKICTDKRGYDKLLHFVTGLAISLVAGIAFAFIPPHMPWYSVLVALATAALIGCLKEARDSRSASNHFCVWDFLWTLSGAVAVCWLPWLAAYLLVLYGSSA